ncbi:MAG: tetratricopeptide repeat protein [Planctomycetia bacterium]|nr:tetratricopeptide repeat protein [Planctomycetia bacterium]
MNRTTTGRLLLVLLLLIPGVGCHAVAKGKKTVEVESEIPLGTYRQARLFHDSGDYLKAVAGYRQVIACSPDPLERENAKIGAAECLMELKKYPAALATLEPLPLQVKLETDAVKLALAGETLLHQHRYEEAEVYLEIALNSLNLEDYTIQAQTGNLTSAPKWMAPAAANLGCACLKNDKPEEAMVMYQFSALIYRASGNSMAADKSQKMYNDLADVIRLYAPHKPIPVVKGTHAGRF